MNEFNMPQTIRDGSSDASTSDCADPDQPASVAAQVQVKHASSYTFEIDSLIHRVKQSMMSTSRGDLVSKITAETKAEKEDGEAAAAAVPDKKIWRKGMQDGDQDSTKTVFIRKTVHSVYNEYDCSKENISYKSSSGKLLREIEYFTKIIDRVQNDMIDTEYKADAHVVMDTRGILKERLTDLTVKLNAFIADALEGDIKPAPVKPEPPTKDSDLAVEYIFASDRKPTVSESGTVEINGNRIHKCADCNVDMVINPTDTIESVMAAHLQTAVHRSAAGITAPIDAAPGKSPVVSTEKVTNTAASKKLAKKDTVTPKALMINRMVPHLIDDSLLNCQVCGLVCDVRDPKSHISLKQHVDNLVSYNHKLQYQLIAKNPDAFASFNLTELHFEVNRIFVDPVKKFAYCGICQKEVPAHQNNIEGHVDSPNHNKLLLALLDSAPIKPDDEEAAVQGRAVSTANVVTERRPSNAMDTIGVPEKSSLLNFVRKNHGFLHANGTYTCLICNIKRLSTVKRINGHFGGKLHMAVVSQMAACTAVEPHLKTELIDNYVSVGYGGNPLIFECMICPGVEPTNSLQEILMHVAQEHHQMGRMKYLHQPASLLPLPHIPYAKIVMDEHCPGKMFCISCHLSIGGIVEAFEHIKASSHNPDTLVEYIVNTGRNCYKCMICFITLTSDGALVEHVASQEHKVKNLGKLYEQSVAVSMANSKHDGARQPAAQKNAKPISEIHNAAATKKVHKEKTASKNSAKGNEPVSKVEAEEKALLDKNGILQTVGGSYVCHHCGMVLASREKVLGHIFSFKHAEALSNL